MKEKNLLISLLFSAYVTCGLLEILGTSVASPTTNVLTADIAPNKRKTIFYTRLAHYGEYGELVGCWGEGSDCWVAPIPPLNKAVAVSARGAVIQPIIDVSQ